MKVVSYIVDSTLTIEDYYYTKSVIYLDLNNTERVAYSGCLREGSNKEDMVFDEFIKMKARLGYYNLIVINQADYDQRLQQYNTFRKRESMLITKADFERKQNCMPPQRWTTQNSIEIFHMKERLSAGLVTWLGRKGSRYFELVDEESADLKAITLRFEALASYSMGF